MIRTGTLISAAFALTVTAAANAALVLNLGGGWQATIQDDVNVDLAVDFVSIQDNILVIEKFANFISIDPFTGMPMPIAISFNQIASDAQTVSKIVITDEIIANNTGLDWVAFRNEILGGSATFNQAQSASFSINPFTNTTYSAGSDSVTYDGGVISSGTIWAPGTLSGGLVIDIDLSGDSPVKFILKEIPMVPAPAGLALLGAAALGARRRRA
jgi:hypothetical protein